MEQLTNGLPRIIIKKVSFSCFMGIVKGSIEVSVYDQQSTEFPTHVVAETNMGSGGITVELKGNETVKKKIKDISLKIEISQWDCTDSELSFHVKATAEKGFFSCSALDESFKGERHNPEEHNKQMEELYKKLDEHK